MIRPATTAQTPFRAGRAVAWLAGFGAFGLGLSALYASTGLGVGCPFRAMTGWDCPLCGGTRLGGALLNGDVATAFAYNPVVFIGLIVCAVLGVAWVVEAAGGPALRPPAGVRNRLRSVSPTGWLVVGVIAATTYTLVRNLL